jgi:hypothetical protein
MVPQQDTFLKVTQDGFAATLSPAKYANSAELLRTALQQINKMCCVAAKMRSCRNV